MEQWLNIESQKGKLQLDWNTREQQLQQSLNLLSDEKTTLQTLLKKTDTEKSDVDKRRFELSEKQSLLENEQVEVKDQIYKASVFSRNFLKRLPPPLQIKWQKKLLILTQEGATDSEKLERILTLYKMVNEFDDQ
jgi:vacuolar-type H+-ATPase subunit I/STV1